MTEWNPDNPADLRIWDDVIYEVSAFNKSKLARQACTSIVAQRHDIPREEPRLLMEVLRNTTIIVDFHSGGKTLYTGTTARLTSFKDHSKLSPLKNNFEQY